MANKVRLLGLAGSAGCALAAPPLAQESLLDIYNEPCKTTRSIREAEATYLATAEVKPQARSTLLPTLNFGSTVTHRFSESQAAPRSSKRLACRPAARLPSRRRTSIV